MQATSEAHERAVWAAERDARDTALAMRAVLAQPAVLELCPVEQRFEVRDGEVVVADRIGWLLETDGVPLDSLTRERLVEVQRLEFNDGEQIAAAQRMDAVLRRLDGGARRSWPVLGAAAWQAHRRGDDARCEALLADLQRYLAKLPPTAFGERDVADAFAALCLLQAERGRFAPAERAGQLAALPRRVAKPTLRRLHEHGHDVAAIETDHAARTERRALLRRANRLLREPDGLRHAQAFDGQVALWFPGGDGAGRGALLPRAFLQQLHGLGTRTPNPLELPPVPARGALRFEPSAAAATVLSPLAWIAPPPVPALPWYARPAAVWSLGALLLLLFGGSVLATMRALRRENAAMRARTEFLSGVTHELKTPVASLRLIADVLHDDEVRPERQRDYFAMMAGETARLSALIDNVLDLGQLERGERAYDLRDDDAADVVREAVRTYAPLGERHGLTVTLHEGAAAAPARLDRGAITQTLLNLLENARKYASGGRRVDVHTFGGDGRFTVRVRDHGPGVPGPERERIFERFRRGTAHQSGAIAGVGLGLFLSRAIVSHHGGTLTCNAPDDGDGCAFDLVLPTTSTSQTMTEEPQR